MVSFEVHPTVTPRERAEWRRWLEAQHATEPAVWVLFDRSWRPGEPARPGGLTYLDVVEECLCFGWIDGLGKTHAGFSAQRVTPRRKGGNWTELNKERCRRLIAAGLMTQAGRAVLPDLDAPWELPKSVERALRRDATAWRHWQSFPALYQRIRAGNVVEFEQRDPAEFEKRLANLLAKTREGKMYGAWDDTKAAATR